MNMPSSRGGIRTGPLEVLNRLCYGLSTVGIALAATCMLIVGLLGTVDVLGTTLFSEPVPVAVEFSSYMMIFIVFGAFAHAQWHQEHIAIDMIVKALPPRLQTVLRVVSLIAGTVVFVLLAWRAWPLFVYSWEIKETAAAAYPFAIWPFKFGAFLLLVVGAIEFARQTVLAFAGREWFAPNRADEELI
jgi:TRAP-type C4-dicarboxylate transport system permease small subunit